MVACFHFIHIRIIAQCIKCRNYILQSRLESYFGALSVFYIIYFYFIVAVVEIHFEVLGIASFVNISHKKARFAISDAKITFIKIFYLEEYTRQSCSFAIAHCVKYLFAVVHFFFYVQSSHTCIENAILYLKAKPFTIFKRQFVVLPYGYTTY